MRVGLWLRVRRHLLRLVLGEGVSVEVVVLGREDERAVRYEAKAWGGTGVMP